MSAGAKVIPRLAYAALLGFVLVMALRSHSETTILLVLSAAFMFFACWANAVQLMGAGPALGFVLVGTSFGWFAEQMGSTRGWFFGQYDYTAVLGWRIGDVPAIIPLMWFVLTYSAWVMAHFMLWRKPLKRDVSGVQILLLAALASAIVVGYDLGADPYMVFKLEAWIMTKKDGGWFGETLQGFVGWFEVSFAILVTFMFWARARWRAPQAAAARGYTRWDALLPLSVFFFSMVFQVVNGTPIETRVIALFAMGFPLVSAVVGWWHWKDGQASAANGVSPVSDARLAQMRFVADPLADQAVAQLLQAWTPANRGSNLARLGQANQQFALWSSNQAVAQLASAPPAAPGSVEAAMQAYLKQGQSLPPWADARKIARAEQIFTEHGPVSCALLFCASLPECYVVPDLAAVLHAAGQLEQHTVHRIRSTAAMVFPVMFEGGLTQAGGAGLAQVLKVRLIHATIRHLILHESPQAALAALGDDRFSESAARVAAQALPAGASLYDALLAHGWDTARDGLPCGQEELAYTLLTFSYVFLRGMRSLGQGLPKEDEEAYLHAWNVVGHVLGIRRELMADTMSEAAALFAQIQARDTVAEAVSPDPRPGLGGALISAMQSTIPWAWAHNFPVQLTRYLCGSATARTVGVTQQVPLWSRALFLVLMSCMRLLDGVVGLFVPGFSLSTLLTRVLGRQMVESLLLDQTRPLQLPEALLQPLRETTQRWGAQHRGPGWMRHLEDKLSGRLHQAAVSARAAASAQATAAAQSNLHGSTSK
jgi:uncharacterized membrane protein